MERRANLPRCVILLIFTYLRAMAVIQSPSCICTFPAGNQGLTCAFLDMPTSLTHDIGYSRRNAHNVFTSKGAASIVKQDERAPVPGETASDDNSEC
jgi:hypothetical protein